MHSIRKIFVALASVSAAAAASARSFACAQTPPDASERATVSSTTVYSSGEQAFFDFVEQHDPKPPDSKATIIEKLRKSVDDLGLDGKIGRLLKGVADNGSRDGASPPPSSPERRPRLRRQTFGGAAPGSPELPPTVPLVRSYSCGRVGDAPCAGYFQGNCYKCNRIFSKPPSISPTHVHESSTISRSKRVTALEVLEGGVTSGQTTVTKDPPQKAVLAQKAVRARLESRKRSQKGKRGRDADADFSLDESRPLPAAPSLFARHNEHKRRRKSILSPRVRGNSFELEAEALERVPKLSLGASFKQSPSAFSLGSSATGQLASVVPEPKLYARSCPIAAVRTAVESAVLDTIDGRFALQSANENPLRITLSEPSQVAHLSPHFWDISDIAGSKK
jgi:hypothetical protein